MKKLIPFFAMLLLGTAVKAQTFYNTYPIPAAGFGGTGNSIALLNNEGEENIVFSNLLRKDFTPSLSDIDFALVKTDAAGNPITVALEDTGFYASRIIETIDNGVLVVSNTYSGLIVRKYDFSLNQLWVTELPAPPCTSASPTEFFITDIEKVFYPDNPPHDQEHYYIIYTAGPIDPSHQWDLHMAVARIDQNGGVVWNKVYTDPARPSYSYEVLDYGNAITSLPSPVNPNEKWFALAGLRVEQYIGWTNYLSCMIIDENGSPVSPYQKIDPPGTGLFASDIIWDGDSLVMTATLGNNGFCSDPNNVSGYSVLKFDNDLTPASFRMKYIWNDCENYAYSITMSSDGNYVIGGLAGQCTPTQGNTPFPPNPSLLKIDRTNLSEIFFRRYNVTVNEAPFSFHRTNANDDNFLTTSNNSSDLRLIKTDANGDNCRAREFTTQSMDLNPAIDPFDYVENDITAASAYSINITKPKYSVIPCADGSKPTNVKKFEVGIARIYPTILNADQTLTCDVSLFKQGDVNIVIHNSLGQTVYNQTVKSSTATTNITIDGQHLSQGLNVVRIISNGKIIKTEKVVVQ